MGFHLRGYTFLCDQGFGSYGQNKFWINTLSIGGYSVIGARACGRAPAGAYSTSLRSCYPHLSAFIRVWGHHACSARMTSCLIRAYDVMPYPRACDVIIRVYPRAIISLQPQGRLLWMSKVWYSNELTDSLLLCLFFCRE